MPIALFLTPLVIIALETQYSGDTILLIFPDGTSPALLSAMISGIPFNRVHELNFNPGEIRFNVTMDNVLNHLASSTSSSIYKSKISKGKEYLRTLLETDTDDIVNVKEEQERAEMKRQKELYETKQNNALKRSTASSTNTISLSQSQHLPAFGALLAISVAAIGKVLRKDDNLITESNDSRLEKNQTIDSLSTNIIGNEIPPFEPITISPPTTINGEKSKEEKVKLAEDAMKSYLDQGDGSDEWLGTIADIINDK